jgi:OOP family OmpA-OmpF porin
MKKLLLIPALLLGTAGMAKEYKYEISPMIGYNIAEGNLGFDNNGYLTGGVELQFNSDSKISPEISLFYAPTADYDAGGDTKIARGMFNAVYTFDKTSNIIPFAKLGGGLEQLSTDKYGNDDGFFFDAGAGLKVPFSENWAFKLEAIYMAKINHNHAGNADSNLLTLAGLTYSFGARAQKKVEEVQEVVEVKEEVVVVAPVVVDTDKDGVIDANDKCANTPLDTPVDANGCALDDDNDGVINTLDQCPATQEGIKVDENGCDIDLDKDGVINANDICADTPLGAEVNSDGCPKAIDLHLTFENNSYKVKPEALAIIDKYADFLKTNTNYSAKIVGYSDSRGSAAYNKKLSAKRAKEVVNLLVARGVNPSQLSYEGRGEANPIASNATAEGRAKNRRIEAELTRN